jgi:NADH-quinone oxidoreductase subunit E
MSMTPDNGADAVYRRGRLPAQAIAELEQLAGRYPQPRSALLPMLHLVQSVEGYVSPEGIEACADVLGLTPADVSGVATFYTMYKRRPVGEYHVGVCTNTLCAIMGGDAIFSRLKEHLDVGNDETTEDGRITLEHVECNAACDYAPVVMVNWEFFDNQTPESAVQLVDDLRAGAEVQATRGARLCTWREAERVLAGFPDDRADEGPVAGPASLVGLEIARQRGWKAPGAGTGTTTGQDGSAEPSDGSTEPSDGSTASATRAAESADTHRAESEAKLDESQADVVSTSSTPEDSAPASQESDQGALFDGDGKDEA